MAEPYEIPRDDAGTETFEDMGSRESRVSAVCGPGRSVMTNPSARSGGSGPGGNAGCGASARLKTPPTTHVPDRGAGLPTAQAAFEGSAAGGAMTKVPGISLCSRTSVQPACG